MLTWWCTRPPSTWEGTTTCLRGRYAVSPAVPGPAVLCLACLLLFIVLAAVHYGAVADLSLLPAACCLLYNTTLQAGRS